MVSIDAEDEYQRFEESLNTTNCERVLSVSKKEKAIGNALFANGMMYYNDVVEPAENVNTASLTNALTQYPGSVISLQIIPTKYNIQEIYSIEQSKNFWRIMLVKFDLDKAYVLMQIHK